MSSPFTAKVTLFLVIFNPESSSPLSFLQPVSVVAAKVAAINVKNVVFIAKFFCIIILSFQNRDKGITFYVEMQIMRDKEVSFL